MTYKPRILIAMHYLELGGAETALIGLLDALDPARADVDLFLYSHRGELMQYIPDYINLLPENGAYASIEAPASEALRRMQPGVLLGRWQAKRHYLRHMKKMSAEGAGNDLSIFSYFGKCVNPWLPQMSARTYDLAISFMHPHQYLLSHVKARRKLAWIHTDYSVVDIDWNIERPVWEAYDAVASISPDVTRGILSRCPSLESKILPFDNILPVQMIRRRATEGTAPELNSGCFNMLSVGRYSDAKNFLNVPDIMRRIIAATGRDDLRWYIIGYGSDSDERAMRAKIAEAGVEGCVVLLGKRSNPYPYMAAADLYVQPSRYEGRSMAVREAQSLGRPVALTAYPTAASQIADGVEGAIVPLDNAGAAAGLAALISAPDRLAAYAAANAARDHSGFGEVEKIYTLASSL